MFFFFFVLYRLGARIFAPVSAMTALLMTVHGRKWELTLIASVWMCRRSVTTKEVNNHITLKWALSNY